MRAIVIENNALVEKDVPEPECKDGQVKIRVAYAGLNRADIFQRQGLYPAPDDAPADIPGLEISGEIVEVAADVGNWVLGDEICALLPGGGYAEYCTVDARLCLPIPYGLDLKQAAALPECVTTVWMTLFDEVKLQPGQKVLVHGGSSGIGTTAIQMVKAHGADLFVTAGSADKCALCESLGATAINYKEQDFVDIVKSQGGVDFVLDMVGGEYISKNLKCLQSGGTLISIACLDGANVSFSMAGILMKGLHWVGCTLRSRSVAAKHHYLQAIEAQIWPQLADGKIKPVIDSCFALKDAKKAHEKMEKSLHLGKILLEVDG